MLHGRAAVLVIEGVDVGHGFSLMAGVGASTRARGHTIEADQRPSRLHGSSASRSRSRRGFLLGLLLLAGLNAAGPVVRPRPRRRRRRLHPRARARPRAGRPPLRCRVGDLAQLPRRLGVVPADRRLRGAERIAITAAGPAVQIVLGIVAAAGARARRRGPTTTCAPSRSRWRCGGPGRSSAWPTCCRSTRWTAATSSPPASTPSLPGHGQPDRRVLDAGRHRRRRRGRRPVAHVPAVGPHRRAVRRLEHPLLHRRPGADRPVPRKRRAGPSWPPRRAERDGVDDGPARLVPAAVLAVAVVPRPRAAPRPATTPPPAGCWSRRSNGRRGVGAAGRRPERAARPARRAACPTRRRWATSTPARPAEGDARHGVPAPLGRLRGPAVRGPPAPGGGRARGPGPRRCSATPTPPTVGAGAAQPAPPEDGGRSY